MHITLVGDSVFDNAAYTSGAPSVSEHLAELIAPDGTVTLLARDGAVTSEVLDQLSRVPPATTHLLISSGGNDALQQIDLLTRPAGDVAEALDMFREPLAFFERNYRLLLKETTHLGLPTRCCTIYNGSFDGPAGAVIPTAVSLFDDIIYRVAGEFGFSVIELRRVCREPVDFVDAIEPSGSGGKKIAAERRSRRQLPRCDTAWCPLAPKSYPWTQDSLCH